MANGMMSGAVCLMLWLGGLAAVGGSPAPNQGGIGDTRYAEVLHVIELKPAPDWAFQLASHRQQQTLNSKMKRVAELERNLESARERRSDLARGTRQPLSETQREQRRRSLRSLDDRIAEIRRELRPLRGNMLRMEREVQAFERNESSVLLVCMWDGFKHRQLTAYSFLEDARFDVGDILEVQGRIRLPVGLEPWNRLRWNELESFERLQAAPEGFWHARDREDLTVPVMQRLSAEKIASSPLLDVQVIQSSDPDSSAVRIEGTSREDPAWVLLHIWANDREGNPAEQITADPLLVVSGPGHTRFQIKHQLPRRWPFGYTARVEQLKVWHSVPLENQGAPAGCSQEDGS